MVWFVASLCLLSSTSAINLIILEVGYFEFEKHWNSSLIAEVIMSD